VRSRFYTTAGECAACSGAGYWYPHSCMGPGPYPPVENVTTDPRSGLSVGDAVEEHGERARSGTVSVLRYGNRETYAVVETGAGPILFTTDLLRATP
jgi:hypothetical protein